MPENTDIVMADQLQPVGLPLAGYEPQRETLSVTMRVRWRTFAVVFVLFAIISLGAVWLFVHPKYKVTATVHVAPVVRPVLFADIDTDISRRYREFLATVALNMVSPAVITAALEMPALQTLPTVAALPDSAAEIASRLEVEQIPGTQLLSASMSGTNPADMAAIVNGIIEAFLQRREDKRREWDEQILASLRREASDLETKLRARREQLRQTAKQSALGSEGESGSLLETWVVELQQLLADARRAYASAAAKLGNDESVVVDPAGFESYLAQDPQIQTLKDELRTVELSALSDQTLGRGPGHPAVQSRPVLLAALKERIEAREKGLREIYAVSTRLRSESAALEAKTTAEFLETELAKAQTQLAEQRAASGGEQFLLDDLTHERERFENDLNRVRQKMWNIELERNRTARISIASHAIVPEEPNMDKRLKYGAVAVLFSFMIGVGAAMLRQSLDTRFRGPSDVTSRLGVRVLGSVRHISDTHALQAPDDARIAEPIRGISTALLASSQMKESHSRLVTSPTAQSGKSSMALNLARSLASTGRRVLLVDADNNGQGASYRLGMLEQPGLKELLEGERSALDVIRAADPPLLHVLPAGRRYASFSDLLARRQAQATLRSVFAEYDEIIVDSGPVLAGSSTVILATLVDEVVLVLRAGRSKTNEAQAAQQHLAGVGSKVVGVILNDVDERTDRYSYSYAYTAPMGNGTASATSSYQSHSEG
ncbi:MAG: AAA family ATPase [Phycisphaerales bacterium]|nr:MAG: AAA family ATPase [Phycisphaerales bacterium]